jgi:CubicO group peptidase (beta-lactamase class C family)/ketosteroid isomerase-like protein
MKLSCSLLILAIAFSLSPLQPLVAQVSPHPPSAAAKDVFIRQIMEDAGIPGLQAVVVRRDKIVWSNSYGDSVLDAPGPRRAMNDHDLILTASTTKLCVTIAALQQLEKGKLALDDDINRSLPFPVRNPNWPDVPITWRMLLTHTSSIDDTTDALNRALFYWGKDHPLAFDDYVKARFLPGGKYHAYELFRSGKPGSERIYSNDGFSLLAFALEQVTHESFDAYVRRKIWTPLKMNETTYSLAGLSPDHLAVGYGAERKADGTFSFVPAKVFWGRESASGTITDHQYSYPDYPVGRTYTNARDFARLILMFLNGGTVDGARILSPASVDMIFTPSGYRNLDGWKQGIGVNGPLDLRGRQVWGHDGQGEGSVSALYVNRESGVGAFTIANSNYLDESQNYSLVDLDMHLMAWFEDSAADPVAANYVPALEKGNGQPPPASAVQKPDQSPKSNRRTAQKLSSQQQDVWKGEQDSFRYLNTKDLKAYMSMWDANFVGWPDYNDRPVRKADIQSSAVEEFRTSQTPSQPLPAPQPEAVAVFGDVAVTHYFWPEVDQTSPTIYRITHTWQRGRDGWHIIGGMSCPVPRSGVLPSDEKRAIEQTIRSFEAAMQDYDFTKADTFYAPEAKWIEGAERGHPELAYPTEQGPFWTGAKANKVKLIQELHDFDIQIRGDVA